GRRALYDVPPNPSKMLDAVLVTSGKYTRKAYLRAKKVGKLPSQKYDRNRSAAMAKAQEMDKTFGPQIVDHLKGLTLGEQALVSAAMPLGHANATLAALRAIRGQTDSASEQPQRARPFFPPDVVEQFHRDYLTDEPSSAVTEPRSPRDP